MKSKNKKCHLIHLFKVDLGKINSWFEKIGLITVKLKWCIIFFTMITGIWGIIGLSKLESVVSIDNFFLENDPIILEKQNYEEVFGNSDFIGIQVDAEDIFSYETLTMIRSLGNDLKDGVPFADKLISLTDLSFTTPKGLKIDLSRIEIPEDKYTVEEIRNRFDKSKSLPGRLYSTNYKQTWIFLRLKEYPKM